MQSEKSGAGSSGHGKSSLAPEAMESSAWRSGYGHKRTKHYDEHIVTSTPAGLLRSLSNGWRAAKYRCLQNPTEASKTAASCVSVARNAIVKKLFGAQKSNDFTQRNLHQWRTLRNIQKLPIVSNLSLREREVLNGKRVATVQK